MSSPTLSELAARIDAHLCSFNKARDPKFHLPGARRCAKWVDITYRQMAPDGFARLELGEAERYLAWLDAGNVGRHWEMT